MDGQGVVVAGARILRGLDRKLCASATDNNRQVIRRAGGGADTAEFLIEESWKGLWI